MRNSWNRLMNLSLVSVAALWSANAQILHWIYDSSDTDARHRVWGYSVSEDGRYVVGSCISGYENYDSNRKLPFLWDKQTGYFDLSFARCNTVGVEARDVAYADNDRGSSVLTVVGGIPGRNSFTPFVWRIDSGCQAVNSANIGFAYSLANDYIFAGADYSSTSPKAVIWGSAYPRPGLYRKVLQNNASEALAVAKWNSPVVVGWATNGGIRQAVVWRHTGVRNADPTPQYFLPYPSNWDRFSGSAASAVSADGRFITGQGSGTVDDGDLLREVNGIMVWSWDGQNPSSIELIGLLNGASSHGISADGTIIVGVVSDLIRQQRAYRWRRAGSNWVSEDLNRVYSGLLRDGSVLQVAHAISPDGRYIAGWGYNASRRRQEAFLLELPCAPHLGDINMDGCVNDVDLLQVLFSFGQTGGNLGRVDVNCDNKVNDADLITVLFNFGVGC
jgi:uncharacterized membrane protein